MKTSADVHSSYIRLLAAVVVLALPSAGSAQSTPSTNASSGSGAAVRLNPFTIEEKRVVDWNSQMTFSGSRTATSLLETPQNISILTSEYLRDIGANNLMDALRFAGSGTTMRVTYRDDITIRGFRQESMRDGVTMISHSFTPFYDVERVEVVKGPQALIFSNYGSISGAVNYVTKRPTSTPTGDLSLAVGSWDTYIASFTQRGPLSADGRVRYRVTAGAQESGGWMGHDQPGANIYTDNRLISASVDWTATDKLEFRLDLSSLYDTRRDTPRGLINPITRELWDRSAEGYSIAADWGHRTYYLRRANLEGIFQATDDLTFRLRSHFYDGHLEYKLPRPDGSTIGPAGLRGAEAPDFQTIGLRTVYYDEPRYGSQVEVDGTWAKDFGAISNRLTGGWYYSTLSNTPIADAIPLEPFVIDAPASERPRPPPRASGEWTRIVDDADRRPTGGWTAYVNDSATLLEGRLILTGGLRYVSDSHTNDFGETALVPAGGIVYRLKPTISLYAGYAESYTPARGGEDVRGVPFIDEIGENFEAGIKFNALEERLFGSVVYFDVLNDPVRRQIQFTRPDGVIVTGNAQVGKETNKGWEADVGFRQPFALGTSTTMFTAYLADPKNANGEIPSSSVDEKYTFFTKFVFDSASIARYFVSGGVTHVGEAPGTGFPKHPAYTLVQAGVGYQASNWALRLSVENLTDKHGAIIGSESTGSVMLAEPRNFKLTYTRNW